MNHLVHTFSLESNVLVVNKFAMSVEKPKAWQLCANNPIRNSAIQMITSPAFGFQLGIF